MPTPTPTPTPAPTLLQALTGLDPALGAVVHVITILAAAYGFISAVVLIVGFLRRPRLVGYMARDIWPVAEPSQSELAINIQLVVHNPGKRTAFLRDLRGELERPAFTNHQPSKKFGLHWHIFIKGNPQGMEAVEPVYVQVIAPGDSKLVSVQMRGDYDRRDSMLRTLCFDWFPGDYALSLAGLVNESSINLAPKRWFLRKSWKFNLDNNQSSHLSPTQAFAPPYCTRVKLLD
jgi:hypothetical protein